jgi:hypothetical protein
MSEATWSRDDWGRRRARASLAIQIKFLPLLKYVSTDSLTHDLAGGNSAARRQRRVLARSLTLSWLAKEHVA